MLSECEDETELIIVPIETIPSPKHLSGCKELTSVDLPDLNAGFK